MRIEMLHPFYGLYRARKNDKIEVSLVFSSFKMLHNYQDSIL